MSTTKTFAGASYNLPLNREPKSSSWGVEVSNFLIALADNAIPKTGGAYTLTAELNLGATYGLLAPYLKSAGTNIATAGAVRLAKTESIGWRNNANGADLALAINGSDKLTFNGVVLATAGAGSIVNADISASAAIAYSKLALTGSILNSDLAGSIAYSKLSLTGAILNADLAGSIAYSKLSLTGAILNADLAGSIAYSKLSLTGAILNADLAGSIAYSKLSLTGSIVNNDLAAAVSIAKGGTGQTSQNAALNALLPSQTGANGKVLASNGTDAAWAAALTSTLTSAHLFVGSAGNVATDVAVTGDVTISNAGVTALASTLSGVKTFSSGIQLPTAGGTAATLDFYETKTFASTVFRGNNTGSGSQASVTIKLTRIGDLVTVSLPAILITTASADTEISSRTTGASNAFLDSRFRPSSDRIFAIGCGITGGTIVSYPLAIRVTTSGDITLYRDLSTSTNFNTGSSGLTTPVDFTYKI